MPRFRAQRDDSAYVSLDYAYSLRHAILLPLRLREARQRYYAISYFTPLRFSPPLRLIIAAAATMLLFRLYYFRRFFSFRHYFRY